MAKRHESALRQHRRSLKSALRNQSNLARLRTSLKGIRQLMSDKKVDEVKKALSPTISLIDRSVAKGVIHRNAAARLKGRMTRQAAAK